MNQTRTALLIACAALLAACGGSAKTHYYTLQPLAAAARAPGAARNIEHIAITAFKLPELVDRPQLVLRQGETQVQIDDNHLWGQSLRNEILDSLASQLAQESGALRVTLPNQSGKDQAQYKIDLEITRFDSIPGTAAFIEARWTIQGKTTAQNKTGQAALSEPANGPGTHDALVAAHRRALARLAREIAGGL